LSQYVPLGVVLISIRILRESGEKGKGGKVPIKKDVHSPRPA